MKEIEKVQAKIKQKPEDFVVEEIGQDRVCKNSQSFPSNQKPDLTKLEKESQRDFIWCELEKKDIDHFQTIKETARILKKGPDAIGYAGSKDKKAWTTQRISIFKPNLENISDFQHDNIYLKNFKWEKRKIKMGYLEENHFKITLRDVDKKDAIKISSRIKSKDYFPNYFGSQRFGSLRNNNVKIGKAILKRNFEKAIQILLTESSPNERPDIQNARKKFANEKNPVEALKYFPFNLKQERQILSYLARNPQDYLGAIKNAERKNMLMYVNAVQSQIFNQILERALDEGLDFTKKGQESCLLVGYKTRFFDGRLGKIEQEVLEENDLELSDFDVQEIPYLRIKGSFRKAITQVKDLKVEVSDDEMFSNSKKIILEFTLPSGVYATTYLENFFDMKEQ